MGWDEMNAASRTHAANLKPREAPANGDERMYMDETIDFAVKQLRGAMRILSAMTL